MRSYRLYRLLGIYYAHFEFLFLSNPFNILCIHDDLFYLFDIISKTFERHILTIDNLIIGLVHKKTVHYFIYLFFVYYRYLIMLIIIIILMMYVNMLFDVLSSHF